MVVSFSYLQKDHDVGGEVVSRARMRNVPLLAGIRFETCSVEGGEGGSNGKYRCTRAA